MMAAVLIILIKFIMTMYATGFPPGMFERGCPKVVGGLEKKNQFLNFGA